MCEVFLFSCQSAIDKILRLNINILRKIIFRIVTQIRSSSNMYRKPCNGKIIADCKFKQVEGSCSLLFRTHFATRCQVGKIISVEKNVCSKD